MSRYSLLVPQLHEVELFVTDIVESLRFYREGIGVRLEEHVHEDGDEPHYHAVWGDWDTQPAGFILFSLYRVDAHPTTGTSIGFVVEDLDAVHDMMVGLGADVIAAPETKPWGRSASYRDPGGNKVTLTQHPD